MTLICFNFRLFTSDTQAFSSALPWIVLITSSIRLKLSTGIENGFMDIWMLSPFSRYVEVLDKYFGSVCELDIIFNFEKAYFILDELILGGEMQVGKYWLWNADYGIQIINNGIHLIDCIQNIYSLVHGFCQHQETSKKAVLSQIEQADKFQEVRSLSLW